MVVVAGATRNVGPFVVQALLEREATVAVPSRSEEKLRGLREHVSKHVGEADRERLHLFVDDLSDDRGAPLHRERIAEEVAGTHRRGGVRGRVRHDVRRLARGADP